MTSATVAVLARCGVDATPTCGGRYLARCPFHHDRTPSFVVFGDGHWHCFGCGAHGRDAHALEARMSGTAAPARRPATGLRLAPRVRSEPMRRFQAYRFDLLASQYRAAVQHVAALRDRLTPSPSDARLWDALAREWQRLEAIKARATCFFADRRLLAYEDFCQAREDWGGTLPADAYHPIHTLRRRRRTLDEDLGTGQAEWWDFARRWVRRRP